MPLSKFLSLTLCACALLCADENPLTIDLKNPTYSDGTLSTDEGGVISREGFRLQAQKIIYVHTTEHSVTAEGNLMLDYQGRFFVADRLEYDFETKTGTLYRGRTMMDIWFIGGETIALKDDGSFYLSTAYATTCEGLERAWDIETKEANVTKDRVFSAYNIHFHLFRIPVFWVPGIKADLKAFDHVPIRYRVVWDQKLGPRITMRYQVLSWQDLALYLRLDYRFSRGPGGAIESEYAPQNKKITFVTRSYASHDKLVPDEEGPNRYRLQGLLEVKSEDERTYALATWDKFTDIRMIDDFHSKDFVINTQKRTRLWLSHRFDNAYASFHVHPRANHFETTNQELPLLAFRSNTLRLGASDILSTNTIKMGYLDYVYSPQIDAGLRALHLPPSTRAIRLETRNALYRALHIPGLTLTPSVGVVGIFYSNSPEDQSVAQGIFTYDCSVQTQLRKNYAHGGHLFEPYLQFKGLTYPTVGVDEHYYFNIEDGYHVLNQLRFGLRNAWFTRSITPTLWADLYAYAFFGHRAFSLAIPRYYFDIAWRQPWFFTKAGISWNQEKQVWDYTNVLAEFTVNEDIAFTLEYRHRSRYYWRKANYENFILDVSRTYASLTDSPISDKRNTVLAKLFLRAGPKWSCLAQLRQGWGRKDEPAYYALKFDMGYLLTCSWRLNLVYERQPNDNRITWSMNLTK